VIWMRILVRTELLKLSTLRGPWILAFVALALTTLLGVQPVLKAGRTGPSIGTVGAELAVLGAMGRGALVALVIGVLIMTSEFRHQTVTASLLSSPRRLELINAKAVTAALVGLVFGAATMIIVVAIGTLSGAMQLNLINGDIALRGVGLLLTYPLYGLIGVGTGALLARNQPLAVILPVLWLVWLEAFTMSALGHGFLLWSIGGTAAALQNAGNLPQVLPIWLGGGVLLAYALIFLTSGAVRVSRADIS
jgi:ABC-2 type transport system permease protein